jgi:predicted nucleic acid-binding Zn ribbon protein
MVKELVAYRICPKCARAVPLESGEKFCSNDGTKLLEACASCQAPITTPYARFCSKCGAEFKVKQGEI